MATITLVRHGEVHGDWHGRLYGRMDVPLSVEGQAQARAVVRELSGARFAAIYSSGLKRAEFTAELLRRGHPGFERQDLDRLHERDRGDWAGMSPAEIDRIEPGSADAWTGSLGIFTPPGGETVDEVQARVASELDRVAELHRGESICIVAHLWILRAAVAGALGLPALQVARLDIPTSGRVRVVWEPGPKGAPRGALQLLTGTPEVLEIDR